jgi:hypothetical protein
MGPIMASFCRDELFFASPVPAISDSGKCAVVLDSTGVLAVDPRHSFTSSACKNPDITDSGVSNSN